MFFFYCMCLVHYFLFSVSWILTPTSTSSPSMLILYLTTISAWHTPRLFLVLACYQNYLFLLWLLCIGFLGFFVSCLFLFVYFLIVFFFFSRYIFFVYFCIFFLLVHFSFIMILFYISSDSQSLYYMFITFYRPIIFSFQSRIVSSSSNVVYRVLQFYKTHHHHHVTPSAPSLTTPPYRPSLPAGSQNYIQYLHRAAVCMFKLVALPLLGHVKGSTRPKKKENHFEKGLSEKK